MSHIIVPMLWCQLGARKTKLAHIRVDVAPEDVPNLDACRAQADDRRIRAGADGLNPQAAVAKRSAKQARGAEPQVVLAPLRLRLLPLLLLPVVGRIASAGPVFVFACVAGFPATLRACARVRVSLPSRIERFAFVALSMGRALCDCCCGFSVFAVVSPATLGVCNCFSGVCRCFSAMPRRKRTYKARTRRALECINKCRARTRRALEIIAVVSPVFARVCRCFSGDSRCLPLSLRCLRVFAVVSPVFARVCRCFSGVCACLSLTLICQIKKHQQRRAQAGLPSLHP